MVDYVISLGGASGSTQISLGGALQIPEVDLSLAARTSAPRALIGGIVSAGLLNHVTQRLGSTWQLAAPTGLAMVAGMGEASDVLHGHRAQWSDGVDIGISRRAGWRSGLSRDGLLRAIWRPADTLDRAHSSRWREGMAMLLAHRAGHRTASALHHRTVNGWSSAHLVQRGLLTRFGDASPLLAPLLCPRYTALPTRLALHSGWRAAGLPKYGPRRLPVLSPVDPDPYDEGVRLCLRPEPEGKNQITIGRTCDGLIARAGVPIRRTYRMRHTLSLTRLSDGAELPVRSMTCETDTDSYCWRLNAVLAGNGAGALLAPQAPAYLPREVEAQINGHPWRFLVDSASSSRRFGREEVSITGRSRSAWLAEPYSPRTDGQELNPYTARQLAEDVLDGTGWTLVWDLVDWTISAGVLSWDGDPIARLAQLIKPVDGALYTDPVANTITAYPRYPSPAWEWDGETADYSVPELALVELRTEPDYPAVHDGVYVQGTGTGVRALVKIAGTAGADLADPVVDPLLCDPTGTAVRARGIAVLSAAGPGQILVGRTLLTADSQPGILRPGLLLGVGGIQARARSTSISAQRSGDDIVVHQTVTLERREARDVA